MKKFGNILFWTSLVVSALLGLFMLIQRFAHLSLGFSYDELYSMSTSSPLLNFSFIWKEMLLKDVNLPLYNILLYGWNHLFPNTPFWMRLFNASAGALALPVVFFLLPPSWPKLKKFMLVCLAACSFTFTAYGTNIRAYSFAILAVFTFTPLALRIIETFSLGKTPSKKLWFAFFTTGLFGSYLHYFCSGVFFITALTVFLYACYYKKEQKTAFWGTACVFALWCPWVFNTYLIMSAPTGSWWIHFPFAKATWEIIQFNLGSPWAAGIWFCVSVLGMVSLVFTKRMALLKQANFMLPLVQILLLIGVVSLVSLKYNLWLDRYFMILLPALLFLFTEILFHLQARHRILIVILPIFLTIWVHIFLTLDWFLKGEITGLKEAFSYVADTLKADQVFVDMDKTGYPEAALPVMFNYYLPTNSSVKLRVLSQQTTHELFQTPKPPLLTPLCSVVHLIEASLKYGVEHDKTPVVFGRDVCVMTVHPVPKEKKNGKPSR